ncbi:pentapeptide repeat-containing protein [Streptomyces xantholiticus]|uniref:pentapeptide repeat-containing protein n=1 Tax=Streptomyces xantholiticus TaxID=68285 RepID=UPI00167A10B0|nr:pentapeptide repeat-containing protein [Streptomyces xantholiticus]GGW65539.1 hypothetical protein GCM10010381_58280 [Streptomyces xantholiticus]
MTLATPDPPSTISPAWPHCGHGADPAIDPVGCRGIHVPGHAACLAHLDEADRAAYLASLAPGADIDHRGTPFSGALLGELLDALRDPTTSHPRIGIAWFDGATFTRNARFGGATFTGDAVLDGATFSGDVWFDGATFTGTARFGAVTFGGVAGFDGATFARIAWFGGVDFNGDARFGAVTFSSTAGFDGATFARIARFVTATFNGDARFGAVTFSGTAGFDGATFTVAKFGGVTFAGNAGFGGATFSDIARFDGTTFTSDARFDGTTFTSDARFDGTTFTSDARFDGATFTGSARFGAVTFAGNAGFRGATFSDIAGFSGARFEAASRLGPLVCGDKVSLDGAVFQQPVTVEAAARRMSCVRTRWASTATLHLRYAELDLRDAVCEYPVVISARPAPFPRRSESDSVLPETHLSGGRRSVRLTSVSGVDAAHLALHDIDLSECRFAGAVHLDQLRVDGWCTFAATPTGWSRRFPWRWTRRNTLAEEHHWRMSTARSPAPARGWTTPHAEASELRPAAVAALYRQLRKSLEDGKNEPDAADFYYGECEMRRHDITRPWGERSLLTAYWAISGYGLRASRALAWLAAAMIVTVAVMVLWGLPADDPKPQITGRQVAAGQQITLTTDTPDPAKPTGPWTRRVTAERFEKALRVVINSVVFRSSGQNLTTAGTYTEMTSRLAEPVLLGLAVLAVRSRVKR